MEMEHYLPLYMMPSEIIEVSEYPLLSNGKTNIKELLKLLTTKSIILPSNELESALLEIWKDIFGNIPISTDDSFQSVGGNSLSILSLVTQIYKKYNVRFSLSQIFSHYSIEKQAVFITRSRKWKEVIE
jgi:acyl carrier protein